MRQQQLRTVIVSCVLSGIVTGGLSFISGFYLGDRRAKQDLENSIALSRVADREAKARGIFAAKATAYANLLTCSWSGYTYFDEPEQFKKLKAQINGMIALTQGEETKVLQEYSRVIQTAYQLAYQLARIASEPTQKIPKDWESKWKKALEDADRLCVKLKTYQTLAVAGIEWKDPLNEDGSITTK